MSIMTISRNCEKCADADADADAEAEARMAGAEGQG